MQLSTFKAYVKRDFKRDDKDTELVQAYNDSIIQVAIEIPHGGYKYQSWIPLVVEQEDYPLPTNIVHLLHPIRLLDGATATDSGRTLRKVTKERYSEIYDNPNRDSPSIGKSDIYCVYGRSILIRPAESTSQLLEIDWTKIPTDQDEDSDTPNLGDEWRETLKWMTLKRLYGAIGLVQEADYWRSQYEDERHAPIGMYFRLLQNEKGREGSCIGAVVPRKY